ncbi:Cholesterol 24-hydroxylase [Lachnellula suecica]|uniref:Cholesterol 24-hydroxylase n=1 Tax=Lachnellula suecica TaxID=602035 RepID=A0A8T9C2W9_9HELO|nr:Cholesterol 24-hydroxylase [Lachnellula suecica]
MMIIVLVTVSTLSYVLWTLACLESNVRKARSLNIPIVRIPIHVNSILWVVVQPLLWNSLALLPIAWSSYPNFVRFSHRNWHFLEKSNPTKQFGHTWALVSPGGIHLHFSDPDIIQEILSRWRDFVRPVEKYQILAIFGHSVLTVGLEDWPRHRKAVAAPFNEANTKFVWDETLRQTKALKTYWEGQTQSEIPNVQEDLRTLSMNVLAAAAFRESYDFIGSEDSQNRKLRLESYRDSLYLVHKYAIFLMLVPYRILTWRLLPDSVTIVGRAALSLRAHMMDIIVKESVALKEGKSNSGGIIPSLVCALDQGSKEETDRDKVTRRTKRDRLSIEDILGNVFVMNIAGHDTTANTLSFTVMLLAANPDVQDWLREELDAIIGDSYMDEWDFSLFERLKRCQAVLLETLRLYAPITGLPKVAAKKLGLFRAGGNVLKISPGMETFPMLLGIQTDPRYWVDPYAWKPSRWIFRSDTAAPGIDGEQIFVPRQGTFFPWSEGPQNCVGKKFSQVEVTAFLACLLKENQIRAKPNVGETETDARKRAHDCVNDVNYNLLLKMNRPSRVRLELGKLTNAYC